MSHFFFTHSHSHCVSLYFFTRTAPLKMAEYLCVFALSGTHTHWPNMALYFFCMALYFFCFSTPQGRMAFASFFSFSSACPTRFATHLNKRSQTMLFASPNFLSSFSMLDMLQSTLVKRHG